MATKYDKKREEFRAKLSELFIAALTEHGLEWKRGWQTTSALPYNGATGRKYNGVNVGMLYLGALMLGYSDPRWCTYNQAKKNNWQVRKGEKSLLVEYHYWYDRENKRALSWPEFNERVARARLKGTEAYDELMKALRWCVKYSHVFNFEQIDGVPKLDKDYEPTDVVMSVQVNKIAERMGVEIVNTNVNEAFYNATKDVINLPPAERFFTQEEQDATALHELMHATGAATRLNRPGIVEARTTEKYAFEELVAEIGATFMSAELGLLFSDTVMDTHNAYVKSWIKRIEENPDALTDAFDEAKKACDYVHGLLEDVKDTAA